MREVEIKGTPFHNITLYVRRVSDKKTAIHIVQRDRHGEHQLIHLTALRDPEGNIEVRDPYNTVKSFLDNLHKYIS